MRAHERSKARRHADSLLVEYLTRKTGTNFFVLCQFYRSNIQRYPEVGIPLTLILHTLNKIPDRTLLNNRNRKCLILLFTRWMIATRPEPLFNMRFYSVIPSEVEKSFNTAHQTRPFRCAQDDKKNSELKEQVTKEVSRGAYL